MTAPTPNAALEQAALAMRIRDVLVQFDWSNFGLDLVDDAETEWADALAEDLVAEIFGPRPDGGEGGNADGGAA